MTYFKIDKVDHSITQITHEQAVELLKMDYSEKVCTYDEMLEMACDKYAIPLLFNYIEVRG